MLLLEAQHGAGKTDTCTIGLPQRIDPEKRVTQALMLTPTRELAQKTQHLLQTLGETLKIECHGCVVGSNVAEDRAAVRSSVHVVGTVGRDLHLIESHVLRTEGIKMLVLDGVDEMLSAGFAESLHAISQSLPSNNQVLLFPETMSTPMLEICRDLVRDPRPRCSIAGGRDISWNQIVLPRCQVRSTIVLRG